MSSSQAFIILCALLSLSTSTKQNGTNCQNDVELKINISHYPKLHLPDHKNLSSVELSVTYEWNVKGNDPDGFMYCFFDRDTDTADYDAYYDEKDIPKFCESMRGMRMWVTDVRGEYVQCTFPCDSTELGNCSSNNICEKVFDVIRPCPLGQMRTLMKNTTSITLPISFGRSYIFNLFPYRGKRVLGSADTNSHDAYLFCGHHLINKHPVDENAAYDFCRSEQVLSNLTTSSGPPINFTVAKTYRNQSDHTLTVVLQWEAPHLVDNIEHRTPDEYRVMHATAERVYPPVEVIPKPGQVVFNHVYRQIQPNKNYSFMVAAYMNLNKLCLYDSWCQNYGTFAVLEVIFEDWDPCYPNDTVAGHYCHERATCAVLNADKVKRKNCTCDAGYVGDGVSASFGGTGCVDFNPCLSNSNVCFGAAKCRDRPPPDIGYDCVCPDGYGGSGNSHCVHIKSIVLAVFGAIMFLGACLLAYVLFRRT